MFSHRNEHSPDGPAVMTVGFCVAATPSDVSCSVLSNNDLLDLDIHDRNMGNTTLCQALVIKQILL